MKRFVYNEKYAKLMVAMQDKKNQIDELSKNHNINSGHLRRVIEQWSKEKVLTMIKEGKEYQLELTKKGKLFAVLFAKIMHVDKYGILPNEIKNINKEPKTNTINGDKKNDGTTKSNTVQN